VAGCHMPRHRVDFVHQHVPHSGRASAAVILIFGTDFVSVARRRPLAWPGRTLRMAVLAFGPVEACTRAFACDSPADDAKGSGVCGMFGKR
jgi:hypothetical protein